MFSTFLRGSAGLTWLNCIGCRRLICLPALPATLTALTCYGCARLVCLPALPAGLTVLDSWVYWAAVPDVCPLALVFLNGSLVDRRLWRQQVAERHARQRAAVAAALLPLALLYV